MRADALEPDEPSFERPTNTQYLHRPTVLLTEANFDYLRRARTFGECITLLAAVGQAEVQTSLLTAGTVVVRDVKEAEYDVVLDEVGRSNARRRMAMSSAPPVASALKAKPVRAIRSGLEGVEVEESEGSADDEAAGDSTAVGAEEDQDSSVRDGPSALAAAPGAGAQELLKALLGEVHFEHVRHGEIVAVFPNGRRYEGQWERSEPNGFGTMLKAGQKVRMGRAGSDGGATVVVGAERYEGQWRDGRRNGQGLWEAGSGERYEGEWVGGAKHGWGSFLAANGDTYVGEWRQNVGHGKGRWESAGGDVYEGEWVMGRKHGR